MIHKEHVAIASLCLSVACHGIVLMISFQAVHVDSVLFVLELRGVVLLSLATSIFGFVVNRLRVYAIVHFIRFSALIIAVRIVGAGVPLIELLLVTPLLIETAFYLGARRAVVVNVLQVAAVLLSNVSALWSLDSDGSIAHTVFVGVFSTTVAALAVLVVHYRERYVQSETQVAMLETNVTTLSSANKAFQHYAGQVEIESATQERLRITRELHDTVGYALTSVIMSMNAGKVLHEDNPSGLPELLENTRLLAEAALGESRSILYRLRAIRAPDPQCLRAVTQLVKAFMGATDVHVELNYGNLPISLGPDLNAAIYRLIQEGLTNAFRHGKANFIRVNLWQSDSELLVAVWDNGRGIPGAASSANEGIGIKGMRERFAAFHPTIVAKNVAGGFELSAVIPRSSQ